MTSQLKNSVSQGDIAASRASHLEDSIIGVQPANDSDTLYAMYINKLYIHAFEGVITIFMILAGAHGGGLCTSSILIVGNACLVAHAFSIGFREILLYKTQEELKRKELVRENWSFKNYPEGKIRPVVTSLVDKGISQHDAEYITTKLAQYPEYFLQIFCREPKEFYNYDYISMGVYCFFSFILPGILPMFTYTLAIPTTNDSNELFAIICCLCSIIFFIGGSLHSHSVTREWWHAGMECFLYGSICAVIAYSIGWCTESVIYRESKGSH